MPYHLPVVGVTQRDHHDAYFRRLYLQRYAARRAPLFDRILGWVLPVLPIGFLALALFILWRLLMGGF